jgi:hypothetical protein
MGAWRGIVEQFRANLDLRREPVLRSNAEVGSNSWLSASKIGHGQHDDRQPENYGRAVRGAGMGYLAAFFFECAVTPGDFRRIALSMPAAVEVYRGGHSEFRWNERRSPA